MSLNCEEYLTDSILKDCDNKPKGGIEVDVTFIAFDDVDKTSSTLSDTNDLLITDLVVTAKGYSLEGIKQVNGASFELVKKEDAFDKYTHTFAGVILNPTVENKKRLSELASGARYIVIVEKKWKGADNVEAFEVLGWDSGLEISTATWSSKESDGTIKFEMASADGFEEDEMTRTWLETDYSTTKTALEGILNYVTA